jgi:hypothetical protein
MILQKSLLALALLGRSTTVLAAPPSGRLIPGALQADYLVNVFNTEKTLQNQRLKPGTHTVKLGKTAASAKIYKGLTPGVLSYVQAIDFAQGSTHTYPVNAQTH